MASLSSPGSVARRRREGVSVQLLPAAARDAQVASLERPWVAEEGPVKLRFRQLESPTDLLLRGLAFDSQRTVTWDEDAVEVVSPTDADDRIVALQSPVLVRSRFAHVPPLLRIDYIQDGVWLASRYLLKGEAEHA